MDIATCKNAIRDAMVAELGTVSSEQMAAITNVASTIASAVAAMVTSATITNIPVLVAPPGGGPVTGTITSTIS
jgi:hypothetical protein